VLLLLVFFLFRTDFYALTLSINVGREEAESYSTVHIKEELSFKCLSETDEFDEIKQIQCVFPREPKEKFEAFETNYFKIDSFSKNGKYILRIYPVEKMQLIPIKHKLYEMGKIRKPSEYTTSSHWMIIGYRQRLPLIKMTTTPPLGIDFPIEMEETKLPSVGALDIAGMPIQLNELGDVRAYMQIKRDYDSGKYVQLSNDFDALFQEYPQTIFKAELLLYKMRGLHHTDESEALLQVSKEFIREYSDDENMAEVLAYTANAYSDVGLQADGSYFYERLFKEYPESKFASLGMVFLGDQFVSGGKQKQAESYFEKALYMTKDVEIASMAAIRLARINLEKGFIDKSAKLFEKIIEGNNKYLLHDINENYDTARAFANRGDKKTAADILTAITEHLPRNDDRYEEMIKDIGVWLSETPDKAGAYKALKRYQEMYGDSTYTAEVQESLDALFYTPEDANKTALIAEYENLENKYPDQEIGEKAALEKAKLYYAQKSYAQVLDMDGSGVEKEEAYAQLRQDSAKALAMKSLEKGECAQAVALSKDYNLTLEQKFDKSLYSCAYKTGNYFLAKTTAAKHLKDKDERLQWLYNYAKTLNKSGQYEELTKVASDVITLSEMEETSAYDDILQDLFYAYERLGNTRGMIKTVKELEKRRGLEYDDIELYVSMIKLGLKENDIVITETYAEKVMTLQEKTNSYSQSPFVEFAALQVLKEQKKEKEQLVLVNKLLKRDLNDKEKSRVQYMLGSLLMKEGKTAEAEAAFEASIKADETSAWAGLSKDALDLIKSE
jgi:predicted negative regulator of RcsB-dependent stress response